MCAFVHLCIEQLLHLVLSIRVFGIEHLRIWELALGIWQLALSIVCI